MTSKNKYPWTLVGELPPMRFVAEYAVQLTNGQPIPEDMLRDKPKDTSLWHLLAIEMYPSGGTTKIDSVSKDLSAFFRWNHKDFFEHVNLILRKSNNSPDGFPLEGPSEFFMEVTREEWETMTLLATTQLAKGWTAVMNSKFSEKNKRCVLAFSNNHLKQKNSRKKNCRDWYGTAKCVFKDCSKYLMEIEKVPKSGLIMVKCVRQDQFNHNPEESHRRPLSGNDRRDAQRELKHTTPSKLAAKQMAITQDSVVALGNLSGTHSVPVLKVAKSEMTVQRHLSPDPWIALCAVTCQLDETCGKGTVSILSFRPMMVSINTLEQFQLWRSMRPLDRNLNIDASGDVIAQPIWTAKKVLIYNATISFKKGKSPIPISEFISDGHSQNEIGFWLGSVKRQYMAVMNSEFPPPNMILVDYSWAIIHAVLSAFIGMRILCYLQACKDAKENGQKILIIIICYSHILRAVSVHVAYLLVKRGAYTVKENLKVKKLLLHTFASILRTDTVMEAKNQFRLLCIVFGSKYSLPIVSEAHEMLMKILTDDDQYVSAAVDLEVDGDTQESSDSDTSDEEELGPVKQKRRRKEILYKDSPFYHDFAEEIVVDEEDGVQINEWFIPGLVTYLLKKYMPFYPLISNYMTGSAGWKRENPPTTTTVEQDFRVMKHVDFQGQSSVPLDIFVQENTCNTLQKIKLVTSQECKKSFKERVTKFHPDKAQEGWQKRRRKGIPAYNKLAAKLRYGKIVEEEDEKDVDDPPSHPPPADNKSKEIIHPTGPWSSGDEHFPSGWDDNKRALNCGGFDILHDQRATLEQGGWVDSQLIDVFLQGVVNEASSKHGTQVQNLSTYLVPGLLKSQGSVNLQWAEKRNIHLKPMWLIPLNVRNVHWALAVVVLEKRQIIIIDTRTDGTFEDKEMYQMVLRFVLTVMDASGSPSTKDVWAVHRPTDIQSQLNSDDCGIHLMIWAYSILMKVSPGFQSTIAARAWLARYLVNEKCSVPMLQPKEGTKWKSVSGLCGLRHVMEVSTEKLEPDTVTYFMHLTLGTSNKRREKKDSMK